MRVCVCQSPAISPFSRGVIQNLADFFESSICGLMKVTHRNWSQEFSLDKYIDTSLLRKSTTGDGQAECKGNKDGSSDGSPSRSRSWNHLGDGAPSPRTGRASATDQIKLVNNSTELFSV